MSTKGMTARDYPRSRVVAPCGHQTPCGCKVSTCCIRCPLPQCVFESGKPGYNTLMTVTAPARRAEARRMRERLSLDVGQIARTLGVSEHTVRRYLA